MRQPRPCATRRDGFLYTRCFEQHTVSTNHKSMMIHLSIAFTSSKDKPFSTMILQISSISPLSSLSNRSFSSSKDFIAHTFSLPLQNQSEQFGFL